MKHCSNRLSRSFTRQSNLYQDCSRKHYRTPEQFPGTHLFAQQNRPGDYGKHRFQTHKQRRNGGIRELLGNDLQGVPNAA